MAKDKLEKCTANATKEKIRHDNPFVQAEGELMEAQLEALADGLMQLTTFYTSLIKEELMSKEKRSEKSLLLFRHYKNSAKISPLFKSEVNLLKDN